MFWEEYLIKEEETVEKHPERDGEDGKVMKNQNSILDYQSMTNEELLKELVDIRSSVNVLKELQEIGVNSEEGFEILIERYKMIKTIIERKRNC